MNNKIKTILWMGCFALFLSTAFFLYHALNKEMPDSVAFDAGSTETPSQSTGEDKFKAPDFEVVDTDGNPVKLSDFLGKPVVLNFWASWCPPCKSEMPAFDRVYHALEDEVIFMMVDLTDGQRETKEKGMQYVNEQGFSFPVYYDITQQAGRVYGIRSIPTTLFIDKEGYVITGAQNAIDEAALKQGIALIKSK